MDDIQANALVTTKDAAEAVDLARELYDRNTAFLRERFTAFMDGETPSGKVRVHYPEFRLTTDRFGRMDTRLSYGFVDEPGTYTATVTRPDLFRPYLIEQIALLLRNHDVPITVGNSATPIPLHFAFNETATVPSPSDRRRGLPIRDYFDVPDLSVTDDSIVNGTYEASRSETRPLGPFTAPRIDYSLHRLKHYTATRPDHFQNFVLFTNYQFYVESFCEQARLLMASGETDYEAFVEPGDRITPRGVDNPDCGRIDGRVPQMPAYHLTRPDHSGVTLVNIGVGPSNAKTITDHISVLRPHAWLMLGHCAGLRNTQQLGDFVLAHGYVREDHVLDADLPQWVPIPPLAEMQVALESAVAEVSGLSGYDLKRVMRTGTVATIDNRNWELRDHVDMVRRFSQSRAIALDMESATIAANGFRFRVPYGTLLCVSDKPLHGELKLPGMASEFYRTQVNKHLKIGLRTMEILRSMPPERLHSRKLRSFAETAFQ
ncbi:MAG: AMP nucleosidase [Pseudomonadota bacterium]